MKSKQQFSGFPDDCSPEQLAILSKFRQEVRGMVGCSDPPYDDVYLLRFLRARKFDFNKALEMWKNFIKWRRDNNVDNILEVPFPETPNIKQNYPHGYFRTDKLGRPIYIERIGALKFDALLKTVEINRLEQYFIQSFERLINVIFPACGRVKGKRVDQTCYIMDLKGAGMKLMSQKMRDILKLASGIGQDYYPETLGNMFIINTPMAFHGVWSFVKLFIDEKTKKKIQILKGDYIKELTEYVAIEDLPDFLGGKATVADYGEYLTNEQGPWQNAKESTLVLAASEVYKIDEPQEEVVIVAENRHEPTIQQTVVYQQGAPQVEPYQAVEGTPKLRSPLVDRDTEWDEFPTIAEEGTRRQIIKEFSCQPSFRFHV